MDKNGKSDKKECLNGVDSQNLALNGGKDEQEESQLLLPPNNEGGLSKKSGKPRRKVQWNDKNGNKLAEVLEFQPRSSDIFGAPLSGGDKSGHQCSLNLVETKTVRC
nr:uncharacterized protein LOC113734324 isoform X2 [Coffea arabica]XP_027118860.1 uncharacterized protein LOC113736203 isoform X1 [Coffea arabica]